MNVTSRFPVVALAEVAEINPRRPRELSELPDDHVVSFVPMTAVDQYSGTIASAEPRRFGDVRKGFTYFAERDVIFAKITPCMQNGKSAIAHDLFNQLGFGSTEFHVIRAEESKIIPEWIWHFVRQQWFRKEGTHHFRGGVGQQRVPDQYLAKAPIPLPPLDEQRRIVNRIKECLSGVDEIDGMWDGLEADYEALKFSTVSHIIARLKEKYATATIGELVGSGRDSMRSGPFGSAMKHGEFVDDGNLVIGIANVQENRFDPVRKWMITDHKFEEMKRYEVQSGDLLITIMGTIGRTCVVPKGVGRAITSKHVYRIRFPKEVSSRYVSFIVNYDFDARRQLYGSAIGGVMPGLNATKLRNLRICAPPRRIQEQAADELEEMHSALDERRSLRINGDLSELRESILREAFAGEL
jgi:type I restriction enzyme, S subunit